MHVVVSGLWGTASLGLQESVQQLWASGMQARTTLSLWWTQRQNGAVQPSPAQLC